MTCCCSASVLRRIHRSLFVGLAGCALALGLVGTAQAASSYTVTPLATHCGAEWAGGQADAHGTLFAACGSSIQVFAPGSLGAAPTQTLSAPGVQFYDVAPNADGSVLYATTGTVIAGSTDHLHRLHRFTRSADGSYAYDSRWTAATYATGGHSYDFTGQYIATDAAGHVFGAQGIGTNNPSGVLEYSASGALVTQFGQAAGSFDTVPAGVGVSADGAHVYVADVTGARVVEYSAAADGSFSSSRTWGATAPATGPCAAGALRTPYDVSVDADGTVYVANTGCAQVQTFTADGAYLATADISNAVTGAPDHGIAVDGAGDIWIGESDRLASRDPDVLVTPTTPTGTGTTTGAVQNAPSADATATVQGSRSATSAAPETGSEAAPIPVAVAAAVSKPAPLFRRLRLMPYAHGTVVVVFIAASGISTQGTMRIGTDNAGWGRWVRYRSRFVVALPLDGGVAGTRITTTIRVRVQLRGANGQMSAVRSIPVRVQYDVPALPAFHRAR